MVLGDAPYLSFQSTRSRFLFLFFSRIHFRSRRNYKKSRPKFYSVSDQLTLLTCLASIRWRKTETEVGTITKIKVIEKAQLFLASRQMLDDAGGIQFKFIDELVRREVNNLHSRSRSIPESFFIPVMQQFISWIFFVSLVFTTIYFDAAAALPCIIQQVVGLKKQKRNERNVSSRCRPKLRLWRWVPQ